MAKQTTVLKFVHSSNAPDFTSATFSKNSVGKYALFPAADIPNAYASDPLLQNKVTAVGANGWQKYVLEEDADIEFMVRGAVGGYCVSSSISVNPSTGVKTGTGNLGGRGAKLKGTGKFAKGTIFYLAVGQNGPGFYNTASSTTVSGGGGGASVVLIDNTSGTYTFAPNNRKVDVLFVAGGGGGAGSPAISTNLYGKDASYNDGTNTNGGTSTGASTGGGGLTGNGYNSAGSNGSYKSFSILSGNSPNGQSDNRNGGWVGGGVGQSGGNGAGGGGYSGGNSYGSSKAADGGTSYINPKYITPTFRGYATYTEDQVNPWYVGGSITFTLVSGRDPEKCILAQDAEGYKYFDGDALDGDAPSENPEYTWKLLPTQAMPEVETYETYGCTDIVNSSGLSGMVKFLIMSPEANETLEIDGNLNGITIIQNTPVSVSDVSLFKNFSITGILTNLDVRFAISKNQGATWQTYSAGNWVDIDITNKQIFQSNGYPLNQLAAIPIEDFNTYKPSTINFAFCITQNGKNTNTILNNIKTVADMVGSWRHFKDSEATYEYVSDTKLKVNFLQAGNYKVNYLDSFSNGSSS